MTRTNGLDQRLYRIIRFDRLVQMLNTDEWHFAHPSEWVDPYESRLTSLLSHALFAQCWCRKGVSDAMWRIYSQDKLGVRIRTTKRKLRDALLAASSTRDIGFRIANVQYLNEIEYIARASKIRADLNAGPTFIRASAHLFLKRVAFEHEAETRVVVFDTSRPAGVAEKSVKVSLKSRQLIDSVLVDPRAPDEFVEAYRHLLKDRLKFPGSVKKSLLYQSNEKREA